VRQDDHDETSRPDNLKEREQGLPFGERDTGQSDEHAHREERDECFEQCGVHHAPAACKGPTPCDPQPSSSAILPNAASFAGMRLSSPLLTSGDDDDGEQESP